MTRCLCFGNTNHAQLIKNCYPLKEGGILPLASQLSYLTFYASSRPAKLSKVGAYMDKKVTKDIRKGRKDNSHVSLLIIQKLIQSCHRDLNIFSKYIVSILSKLLDTRDLDLIDLTCSTFIVFCKYHDGSNLGVDAEFTKQYEDLISKFSLFCNYTNTDDTLELQMKYTGHRAIQATIHSPALQSSEFKSQLHILFIPLVSTLANSSTPLHCIAYDTQDAIDISVSAVNNSTLDISDIERLAAETISAFFNKLNGPSVRMSLVPLFEYMNKEDKWWPPNLSVDIMKLILNSLQPQYRYLLVSDILHNLDKMKYEDITARDAALTMIVNDILNANISLLGISVLEVLNSLFTILTKSAQHYPFLSAPSNETHGNYHYIVQDNLILSISGLASQPYYDNQLNDMIGYLMSKLRANTSLEIVDNIALHSYRVIVLTCLDYVIKGTRQAIVTGSSEPNINLGGYKVFLDTWNPALPLLCDKNSETRIAFCNSLDDFLRNAVSTVDIEHPNHTPQHALRSHQHDALFVECLLQVMYDWIQRPDFGMMDLLYFYSFLCLLVRKFNVDATIVLVPFMFKIQQLLQNNSITVKSRQLALFTVVIQWFMFIADVYHIQSLSAYMDQFMKDLVKRYPHISHLDLQERVLSSVDYQPFMDNSETKPLNIWLERGEIVEAISKEGGMRDPEDIHGLELESKLFSEWGPKLIIKQDRNSKHLIPLQEPKSIKAKLASPWKDSVVEGSIEDSRKDSIRVENLKEALATPAILNEEDKGESSSSQSTSLNDSQYRPMPDMNALLNELSTSKHDQSTVSLVNPPYKL